MLTINPLLLARPPDSSAVEIRDQFHYAMVFLSLGIVLQAFSRDRMEGKYEVALDQNSNNSCGNIGRCKSGREGLKELTPYSVLFSARFFTDLEESGAHWKEAPDPEIKRLCYYRSLAIPISMKTRYAVSENKIWEYRTDAMKITCKEYVSHDTRGYVNLNSINITRDVDVNISNRRDFTARIVHNVMKFSMTCHDINIAQTHKRIAIKDIDESENSCLSGFIDFQQEKNENLNSALEIAMKEDFVRSDQISHWKILVAHLLDEFQDPTNRYIRDLRVSKRVEVYLDKFGQKLTRGLLIVSVIAILVDLFTPHLFLDFLDWALGFITFIYECVSLDVPYELGYERRRINFL